ncbi:MAG: tRNA uridine-5-carboxymethylaminomethyl(34) synthesis GTPase MnmE [Verrucomicrobiota bacterium]
MPLGETIVAPATPRGESAIAMLRLSGPHCAALAESSLGEAPLLAPRKAIRSHYKSLQGNVLDDCVAIYYEGDASYTGEPMLELCLHGNPLLMQLVTEDLTARGCRTAEPGEFTRTAFLNGKIDLSQAEAVSDIIAARSTRALAIAQRQLSGAVSERMNGYAERLLQIQAHLEAYIDFPEEDLPQDIGHGPQADIQSLHNDLSRLIDTQHYTTLLRDGVKVLILGAPNAGKSTLFNTMMGQERVIVSEQPGTTRDMVAERIILEDIVIELMDTAGLHASSDELERMGMEQTLAWAQRADFFLVVVDRAAPYPDLPAQVSAHLNAENALVVWNKADLPRHNAASELLSALPACEVSLKTGKGLPGFYQMLVQRLMAGHAVPQSDELVVSTRHAVALKRALSALERTSEMFRSGSAAELIASELRDAVDAFGEVVGKIDNESMLDQLFARFCIGK